MCKFYKFKTDIDIKSCYFVITKSGNSNKTEKLSEKSSPVPVFSTLLEVYFCRS